MSSSSSLTHETWDVAVIGGGVAGAVAAYRAAAHGLKTLVLEKERGPHHKVCGEFVSGEGVSLMEEIGVDFRGLGAMPIRGFRLHGPHRSAESVLQQQAYGISRKILDEALLERAASAGARIERGALVRDLTESLADSAAAFTLDTSVGMIRARRLIVATGKSEFRPVQSREGRDSSLVGFKMHLRLKPSLARLAREHCELFVFEHGYGGLAPIENGLFNFCFLIDQKALRKIGGDWDALSSHIARTNWRASHYLDGAEPQFKKFVTASGIPYGFVRSAPADAGVFCVGDQMAVIPSLVGDGMSIAAMTGAAAAFAIIDPNERGRMRSASTSIAYQREMRARLKGQVDSALHLHWLFRNPQLCDWATYLVNAFPSMVDRLFARTRTQVGMPSLGLGRAIRSVKRLQA